MTADIVASVLARAAEREALALAAGAAPWQVVRYPLDLENAADPARVLREAAAVRAIVGHNAELHRIASGERHARASTEATYALAAGASDYVLRLTAAIDRDHPDYRVEWTIS